ncbi:hypothetical protein FDP41_011742 [Naegleria fowleri]|uniref:Uncharacterized protein n=1 Tax=Naegleria fowleri TaxID=5763 RepID=A0A6A5C468_NAEFO|nr:uncharacterized protein FDP41_011742 [Naegleria fowleri]KAF0981881.1 hypothetical protein FDP41_011742 [Naegleria fowleri]CAG4718675.1 unnamed protein product [Naegleria fowleri]
MRKSIITAGRKFASPSSSLRVATTIQCSLFHTSNRSNAFSFVDEDVKIQTMFKPEHAKKLTDWAYDGAWDKIADFKKELEGKKSYGNEALECAESKDYKRLVSLKQYFDANDLLEIDDVAKFIVAFGKLGSVPDAEVVYNYYLEKKAGTDREVVCLRNAMLYSYLQNGEEEKAQNFFVNYPVSPTTVTYDLLMKHSWKTHPTKVYDHIKTLTGMANTSQ